MQSVTSAAYEPRRNFVCPAALVTRVVKRQDVDDVTGLIQRIEFFSEPVEMLLPIRCRRDRDAIGKWPTPIHDLVSHNPWRRKSKLSANLLGTKCLNHLDAVGDRCGRYYRPDLELAAADLNYRWRNRHHTAERPAR